MKIPALLILVPFCLCINLSHQKTSPCPSVFVYDERDDSHDTWFGTIRLKSNVPLYGVFVDIVFSAPVIGFGTFLQQYHTDDNVVFHVTDKSYQVRAGETVTIKFYVRYSSGSTVPLLHQIRFNGQNICTRSTPPTTQRRGQPNGRGYGNQQGFETATAAGDAHVVEPITSFVTQLPVVSLEQPRYTNSNSSSPHGPLTTRETNSQPAQNSPAYGSDSFPRRISFDDEGERDGDATLETLDEENPNNGNPYPGRRLVHPTTSRPVTTSRATQRPTKRDQLAQRIPLNADQGFTSQSRPVTTPAAFATTSERGQFFAGDYAFVQKEAGTSDAAGSTPHYLNDGGDICGTVVPKANALVTHGGMSEHGQFPWHGALYRSMVTQLKYLCGATLISRRASLTAAHCVTLANTNRVVDAGSLLLYFGKIELAKWNGPEQDAKITSIHIPAQYNHERFYRDIAVLLLKDDVKYSNVVRPICLWNHDTDYKVLINKVGLIPGWGYNERGLVSSQLSYAQMPVVSHETCIWSNRDFFSRVTSDTSFCAGFKNGTTVCNGDSGGGMVFKISNRWYLRGIVSVSAALQDLLRCNVEHYVVFTDAAKFTQWIKNIIDANR